MRYSRLFVALALAGLLGAACGGDGGGTTDGGDGGGPPTATTDSISVRDNEFVPSEFTVDAGATLILTNGGQAAHTFTLEDGSIDEELDPAVQISVTVPSAAGDYPFGCSFHPEMTGTMTVQ